MGEVVRTVSTDHVLVAKRGTNRVLIPRWERLCESLLPIMDWLRKGKRTVSAYHDERDCANRFCIPRERGKSLDDLDFQIPVTGNAALPLNIRDSEQNSAAGASPGQLIHGGTKYGTT